MKFNREFRRKTKQNHTTKRTQKQNQNAVAKKKVKKK